MADPKTLDQNQIDYITNKVEELGDYTLVCRFYNLKDMVSEFAHELAAEKFGIPKTKVTTKKVSKKSVKRKRTTKKATKKKATTVKRKRKININEVLDEE